MHVRSELASSFAALRSLLAHQFIMASTADEELAHQLQMQADSFAARLRVECEAKEFALAALQEVSQQHYHGSSTICVFTSTRVISV